MRIFVQTVLFLILASVAHGKDYYKGDLAPEATAYRAYFAKIFDVQADWPEPIEIKFDIKEENYGFTHFDTHPYSIHVLGTEKDVLQSVLPHEVLHSVLYRYPPKNIQLWAFEGISTLVEAYPERSKIESHLLQYTTFMPFNEISKYRVGDKYPEGDPGLFYGQGVSMVKFLLTIDPDPKKFARFLHSNDLSLYGLKDNSDFQLRWIAYYGKCRNGQCFPDRDPFILINPQLSQPIDDPWQDLVNPGKLTPVTPVLEPEKVQDTKVQDTKVQDTKVQDTKGPEKVQDTKTEDTKTEDTKTEESNSPISITIENTLSGLLKSSLTDKLLMLLIGGVFGLGGWKLWLATKAAKLGGKVAVSRIKKRRKKPDPTVQDRNNDKIQDQTTAQDLSYPEVQKVIKSVVNKTNTEYVHVPVTDEEGEAYREAMRREVQLNHSVEALMVRIEASKDAIMHGKKLNAKYLRQ